MEKPIYKGAFKVYFAAHTPDGHLLKMHHNEEIQTDGGDRFVLFKDGAVFPRTNLGNIPYRDDKGSPYFWRSDFIDRIVTLDGRLLWPKIKNKKLFAAAAE